MHWHFHPMVYHHHHLLHSSPSLILLPLLPRHHYQSWHAPCPENPFVCKPSSLCMYLRAISVIRAPPLVLILAWLLGVCFCVEERAKAMSDLCGFDGNSNGNGCSQGDGRRKSCWYEEEIDQNLRWCFALNSILHTGTSKYQDIALLDTKPFGKALVIDGKLQSAETDEFIYHESLVHPALLHHPNPRTIFIMGGGEGSTARETLRHNSVDRVVMCDIDQEVVDFCKSYLLVNKEAFLDSRLHLIINDARAELQNRHEGFDVIIGDLADPIEGGPCYQLYTKSFYESIVKPSLNPDGVFVTQAGPAGAFTHTEVFSCIHNTLKHVFKYVVPYSAHVPSYADTWGWVMASDAPLEVDSEELDMRTQQRIKGENRFLDGRTFASASTLSKAVRLTLEKETQLYTEGTAKFTYGHGNGPNFNPSSA